MPHIRFTIDIAIKKPIPQILQNKLPAIKEKILELKSYAEKINAGKDNEEMTVKAVYHICNHDIGLPCESETEI